MPGRAPSGSRSAAPETASAEGRGAAQIRPRQRALARALGWRGANAGRRGSCSGAYETLGARGRRRRSRSRPKLRAGFRAHVAPLLGAVNSGPFAQRDARWRYLGRRWDCPAPREDFLWGSNARAGYTAQSHLATRSQGEEPGHSPARLRPSAHIPGHAAALLRPVRRPLPAPHKPEERRPPTSVGHCFPPAMAAEVPGGVREQSPLAHLRAPTRCPRRVPPRHTHMSVKFSRLRSCARLRTVLGSWQSRVPK